MIFEDRFVIPLFLSTYALLTFAGQFLLLFLVTALVLVMYFAKSFIQLKSERTFQEETEKKLHEAMTLAKKASYDAELAGQVAKDLGTKYGFKSISK